MRFNDIYNFLLIACKIILIIFQALKYQILSGKDDSAGSTKISFCFYDCIMLCQKVISLQKPPYTSWVYFFPKVPSSSLERSLELTEGFLLTSVIMDLFSLSVRAFGRPDLGFGKECPFSLIFFKIFRTVDTGISNCSVLKKKINDWLLIYNYLLFFSSQHLLWIEVLFFSSYRSLLDFELPL